MQDLGIAVSCLIFPAHIVVPLKGLTPHNARFIASTIPAAHQRSAI